MSKGYLRPEAERLYVVEKCTLAEIASRLDVSERTLRTWCIEEDWKAKRRQHEHSRKSLTAELVEFTRSLMMSVRNDLAAGKEVSQARMYGLIRLLGLVIPNAELEREFRAHNTPETATAETEGVQAGDPREQLQLLLKDMLGG